ncbi:apoptosis-associated speck-like protein containing a CARD [Rhinophrynus dorsalis]
MGRTVRDVLQETLENLDKKGFKKFREKLNEWDVKDQYKRIPKRSLEEADEGDVARHIIEFYTKPYGIEVALGVLEAIGMMNACMELKTSLKGVTDYKPAEKPKEENQAVPPRDGKPFVDRHRVALISRMTNVDPVLDELLARELLTDESYGRVRSEITPQDQMRKLYEYMKSWGISDKDQLYEILKEHNGPLIRDLEGK